jgi:hypothetical protein
VNTTARHPLAAAVAPVGWSGARATARSLRAARSARRRRAPSPSPRRGEGARRAEEGAGLRRGGSGQRADHGTGADRRRVDPSADEFRALPSMGGFEWAWPVAVNSRRGRAGSPVRGDTTPARREVPYEPDAPASESMVVPGIHSLARRARIRTGPPGDPEAPASESRVAAGIHSLARRHRPVKRLPLSHPRPMR